MNENCTTLLSIITPTYNGEPFIRRCLDNVIDQQITCIEHIILDGASDDRTAEIVNTYSKIYSHIVLVVEKDSGQSDAMNKGIKKASGKFVCFLNVDDYFEPNTLPWVVEKLNNLENRDLLVGNCNVVNSDGSVREIRRPKKCGYPEILKFWRKDVFPPNPSSYFYGRYLHEIAGLYDENEHYLLDYEMMIRLLKVAHVIYVDRVLGNFFRHAKSKTDSRKSKTDSSKDEKNRVTKRTICERHLKQLPVAARLILWVEYTIWMSAKGSKKFTKKWFHKFVLIKERMVRKSPE